MGSESLTFSFSSEVQGYFSAIYQVYTSLVVVNDEVNFILDKVLCEVKALHLALVDSTFFTCSPIVSAKFVFIRHSDFFLQLSSKDGCAGRNCSPSNSRFVSYSMELQKSNRPSSF